MSRHLLGLTAPASEEPAAAAPAVSEQEDNASHELDLEGIDDAEIDSYIMSPREIHFKTKLWMKLNADFLKEQAGGYWCGGRRGGVGCTSSRPVGTGVVAGGEG